MSLKRTSSPSDEGFTFIEVLVAIAIISFSGFIIWSGISGTFETVLKVYHSSRISGELRQLEYLFRKNVNEMEIPYWDSSFEYEAGFFVTAEDKLHIQSDNFTYQFSFLTMDSLDIGESGMELNVSTPEGESFSLLAQYGSFALMED